MGWIYRDLDDSSVNVDAVNVKVLLLNLTSGLLPLVGIAGHWEDKTQGSQCKASPFFLTPMPQSRRISSE